MRVSGFLVFVSIVLAASSASARQVPGDSAGCVLAMEHQAAEGVADDVGRILELTGALPSRPGLIRRGGARRPVACSADAPLGSRWYREPDESITKLVPLRATLVFNSRYPREANNGALWAGRGISALASGGVEVRYGVLSAALAPALTFAENRSFALPTVETPRGHSPFVYPWHAAQIDFPLRPGPDAVTTVEPGQSFIRVDAYGFAAGFSTENLWWGPAMHGPLLFSNTAPGFPHFFIGTSGPVDIHIGELEVELLWGRVTESDYFDFDDRNDHRLFAGIITDFQPAFAPGLYLGAARTFLRTIPPDGFGIDDYLLEPFRGVRENIQGFDGSNQLVSLFARFVAPGAGLEAYAEWARDDHWEDLEDLVKEPDHSQVYTLGVQKAIERETGVLRLYGEFTHLQAATPLRAGRDDVHFYTNDAVRQGYTHRGQMIGAAIGPGSDSQIFGGDWFTDWGRAGGYVRRTRYDDDAYYNNFGRFYGNHGHDVELTAAARGMLFIHDIAIEAELTYSNRYNRNFVGLDAANFDALFSESNVGLQLSASWRPELAWGRQALGATPASR